MYPLGILAALLLIFSSLSLANYDTAARQNLQAHDAHVTGQLRALSGYASNYARANPGYQGNVSNAAAGMPAWLSPPPTMRLYAQLGRAYVYYQPPTLAEAYRLARGCERQQTCGVSRSGRLYLPGEVGPVMTLPSAIPRDGAVVLVL